MPPATADVAGHVGIRRQRSAGPSQVAQRCRIRPAGRCRGDRRWGEPSWRSRGHRLHQVRDRCRDQGSPRSSVSHEVAGTL
jgi:hypothetical protein